MQPEVVIRVLSVFVELCEHIDDVHVATDDEHSGYDERDDGVDVIQKHHNREVALNRLTKVVLILTHRCRRPKCKVVQRRCE